MNAYDLALECKQEGRVHTPLGELIEYYRNLEEEELILEEQHRLFLEEQEKGTKMIRKLKEDLEKSGYSLDERNRCIEFVEKQVDYPNSREYTDDDVFTFVGIESEEFLDPENKNENIYATLTFETKDGKEFQIEVSQENKVEYDDEWNDYYPTKRVFLDIRLKK